MSIYEKSVKLLFRDLVKDLSIGKGDVLKRDTINSWFKKNYPLIKSGTISAHLLKLSTNAQSRVYYNLDKTGNDDLFFQIDSKKFRLYDAASDPDPIYEKNGDGGGDPPVPPEDYEFAYEKDLQNFLIKNLTIIEEGLTLYEDEGIKGIEFPVGNRFIDLLTVDKNNDFVVIELKVSRGYDRVVGQILRYMAWIRKNQANDDQKVRGIIIAREISDDLLLACSETKNVELYEYNLSVSLNKINNTV